ncbi:pyridoxal phosphate-dependent aminotransferase [Edaphobacter sp.]|uniref:pyridoxal phosphate-dependent aminotransferase n=1 Tax=Edaphobacter sp. TaxID=1934404 RepID=UPI002DB79BEA|nr:pyridoxal phosphate-dependent aminotransferase [Edaphobacter sp.]HEU5341723.1 pyridoxal phosphate-dependent aminotransferase [Edaphobacter sp.]
MSYRFSARTGWDVRESAFAAAVREARAAGRPLIDLTVSNPTVCDFRYDAEELLPPLVDPAALAYDPDPLGLRSAREAVAQYYRGHDAAVNAGELVLTTSTSEGYGFLFRLLCDAGDDVLVGQPSYPLFDFLADLEDVKLRPYPLFYDYGWHIDFAALEASIGPRTRAVVVVHPNNPTGHATGAAERARLERLCAEHGLALIVDEVFLDYPLEAEAALESFARGPHPVLTFVLSGMSKIAGLPQMKAAWIAALGPEGARRQALDRLEVIADTFLSMNAPVQLALPAWLAGRRAVQAQILQRVRRNLTAAQASAVEVLRAEAGWCAILRLPQTGPDAAGELLRQADVVVHPGSFYGIAEAGRVVVSLLGPEAEFREGMGRIAAGLG